MKKKSLILFSCFFSLSLCYHTNFCIGNGIDERLNDIEAAVSDLQVAPRTAKDDMQAALNETWPSVPGTLEEMNKTMTDLSIKSEFYMEQIKSNSERSEKNQEINYRQDAEIGVIRQHQTELSGRQDTMEAQWSGMTKGAVVMLAGSFISMITGIVIFVARAGLLKKFFGNRIAERRAKHEAIK